MLLMPIEVVIKARTIEEAKEALNGIKEINKANPRETIKANVEIDLRD